MISKREYVHLQNKCVYLHKGNIKKSIDMKVFDKLCGLILLVIVFSLFSCSKEKRKADISDIDLDIKIGRFDQRFWSLDTNNMAESMLSLKNDFPEMTDIYLNHVIRFGSPDSSETWETYKMFRRDTSVQLLYTDALNKFADVSVYEKQLTDAFKRAKYFFPDRVIPKIYMHVSGFNQSVIIGNGFISLSEDNYMGRDYEIYQKAMIYAYQIENMHEGKIVSDYIMAWLSDQFPYMSKNNRLLDEMIYRGKLIYVSTLLLPKESDEIIMGYTHEEMEWAKQYEADMWSSLVASQDLFSQNILQKGQYLNDGPFTLPFTQDSPGRGGIYIGWKIVEAYMDRNKSVSPSELMEMEDAQTILEQSGYNPK